MTVGEKITVLRQGAKISQEELAEKLSVSRQSVSKWERGDALPGINKILEICSLFCVLADDLLREDVILPQTEAEKNPISDVASYGNRYFGTDGFRGEANKELTTFILFCLCFNSTFLYPP